MGKSVKKLALLVGVAALAVTGIGLFVAPGAFGVLAGVSAAANAIGITTLASIGLAGVAIGTTPEFSQTIDRTGANTRGQAFVDPNALAAYVFGRTTVPLSIVYEQLHGINEDRVSNVMAHAWHEIEAFVGFYLEGEQVTFSGDNATGDWAGLIEWRRKEGASGQTAIAISELTGGEFEWPSDATFTGVAHSALTFNFFRDPEQEKLKGGVPTRYEIEVDGAMLYDPREDNSYGSGSQDFADPSTWTFEAGNAVLVLLRFAIGQYTAGGKLIWGRGYAESEINLDNFAAMADVADELDPESSVPKFRLSGMHLLDGDWEGFVQRWEHETGGKVYKHGGILHCWLPHDDLTPLTTITQADMLGGVAIEHDLGGVQNLFNTATGRYIEPDEGYHGLPYPDVEESTAITDDGNARVLYHDFSWIQDASRAERIARIKVRRSRFQRTWTFAFGWKGQLPSYAPFTVHTLNIPETGGDDQLVRVVSQSEPQQGVTVLVVQQEDESIYDDTVALGDPHASNEIPARIDRLGTVVPRTVGDGGSISFTPILTNVSRAGSKFIKTAGTDSTWDSAFRSQEGYVACAVSWRASQTNLNCMVALNSDPATDADYDTLDFAIFTVADGTYTIYENGNHLSSITGSYTTSDQFSITYDGLRVRYYKNGAVLRTVPLLNARLFADSSFYSSGAAVNSVSFGPITHVLANAVGWAADSQGKPAGMRGTGIPHRDQVSIVNGRARIASSPDPQSGYALPAIPINDTKQYVFYIRHGSSAASSDGLYIRFAERSSALTAGTTHISSQGAAASEPGAFSDGTSFKDFKSDSAMPGTTFVEEQPYLYTPTSGARFVSIEFFNFDPATAAVDYEIEWCALTELGSNVDLLPGVLPPVDTFGMNPDAATEVYTIEEAGSQLDDPVDDELSITITEQAIVHVEGRCNSCTGVGAQWTPYVGSTFGKTVPTVDGSDNPLESYPIAVHSFDVAPGTYDIGIRASRSGGGNVTVTDRYITITVIKR